MHTSFSRPLSHFSLSYSLTHFSLIFFLSHCSILFLVSCSFSPPLAKSPITHFVPASLTSFCPFLAASHHFLLFFIPSLSLYNLFFRPCPTSSFSLSYSASTHWINLFDATSNSFYFLLLSSSHCNYCQRAYIATVTPPPPSLTVRYAPKRISQMRESNHNIPSIGHVLNI